MFNLFTLSIERFMLVGWDFEGLTLTTLNGCGLALSNLDNSIFSMNERSLFFTSQSLIIYRNFKPEFWLKNFHRAFEMRQMKNSFFALRAGKQIFISRGFSSSCVDLFGVCILKTLVCAFLSSSGFIALLLLRHNQNLFMVLLCLHIAPLDILQTRFMSWKIGKLTISSSFIPLVGKGEKFLGKNFYVSTESSAAFMKSVNWIFIITPEHKKTRRELCKTILVKMSYFREFLHSSI